MKTSASPISVQIALHRRDDNLFINPPSVDQLCHKVPFGTMVLAQTESSFRLASKFLRSGIHVLDILFVFQTYKFEQLGIGYENLVHLESPRLGVGFGILDRDLDFQVSEVHPAEPLRSLGGIRQRVAFSIQPLPVPKAGCLHDQGVAFPPPNRVTVPGSLIDRGQEPPIGEDLPEAGVVLVENQKQPRNLDDLLEPAYPCVSFYNAYRQTPCNGLAGLGWRAPGLRQFRYPGSIGQAALDAWSNVKKLGLPWIVLNVPDSRKVRLTVRCFGSGGGEVRFSVRRSRNPRRGVVQPLRGERNARREQDNQSQDRSPHFLSPVRQLYVYSRNVAR